MLNPGRLRLLVEVGSRGSISAAAEACGVSQPSATKQIKTLEAALGEKLVERAGRASRLTEAGAVVAAHGGRVIDVLQAMDEELGALRDADRGTLMLAASTTAGTYVLPSILQCFADRHPGVDVDVVVGSSSWVVELVRRREVSLGIAGEIDLPTDIRAEPFLSDRLVAVAAPGTVQPHRGAIPADELSRHTLLVREGGSSTRMLWDRHLARAGVHPRKRWELDSTEVIKRAVRAGLGLGLLSERVVVDEVGRDELISFQLEGLPQMRQDTYLLFSGDRELTPAERAFTVTLSDCCSVTIDGCTVDRRANGEDARISTVAAVPAG